MIEFKDNIVEFLVHTTTGNISFSMEMDDEFIKFINESVVIMENQEKNE